jgi:hypothetical protein
LYFKFQISNTKYEISNRTIAASGHAVNEPMPTACGITHFGLAIHATSVFCILPETSNCRIGGPTRISCLRESETSNGSAGGSGIVGYREGVISMAVGDGRFWWVQCIQAAAGRVDPARQDRFKWKLPLSHGRGVSRQHRLGLLEEFVRMRHAQSLMYR